jgi:inhibitor of cysteine peptidase
VAVVLSVAIAACGDDDDVRVFTDDQSGSEIGLGADEQFEIRLESNPSTGFAWKISAMTTPDLVELDSTTYVEPDSDLAGAPGTEVFVFTAGAKGGGVLRLEYVRSFDDPIVPERVAEFIIRIDNADWPPPQGSPPPVSTAVAP